MDKVNQIEQYIFQLFKDNLSSVFVYHNFSHTMMMVTAIKEMINDLNLDDDTAYNMLVAAWFHDSGYTKGFENHEETSIELLENYVAKNNLTNVNLPLVRSLILATKLDAVPETEIEKMFRDADYYHLTVPEYDNYCSLLKKEFQTVKQCDFDDLEWCKQNLEFFVKHHRFYSDYAIKNWQHLKDKNFYKLLEELNKLEKKQAKKDVSNKDIKQKKLEKLERPERGIDTLFRVTLKNHMELSSIADSKANILLSVNSIIISIVLTVIVPKLDNPNNSHLIIPTMILLCSSLSTVTFTILSTKPKVSSNSLDEKLVNFRTSNLLFFGNFHNLSLEKYTQALNDMMDKRENLYDSLIKDLYYLGKVLDKKYRLLSISYIVFLVGIITSVLSFVYAFATL